MEKMSIAIPDSMRSFLRDRVADGGFDSASDYIQSLISADQERRARDMLESEVLKGLDSGPSTPMTSEDWAEIRQEVAERHAGRTAN